MQASNLNSINRLENAFKCLFCQNIYKIPLQLPCGNLICKKDLRVLINGNDSFKCSLCEDIHIEPEGGFKEDKSLRKILDIYLQGENSNSINNQNIRQRSFTLVEICRSKLDELIRLYEEMDKLNKDPNENLYLYFDQLREEIRQDQNEKIETINKAFETIISNLNLLENDFQKDKINENNDSLVCLNIKKEMNHLKLKINEISSSLDDLQNSDNNNLLALQTEIDSVNDSLKTKLNDFKYNLLYTNGKLVKYESKMIDSNPNSYGSLKIENKIDFLHSKSLVQQKNNTELPKDSVKQSNLDESVKKKSDLSSSHRKSVVFDMSNIEQSKIIAKFANKFKNNYINSTNTDHELNNNKENFLNSLTKDSSSIKSFLQRRISVAEAGLDYGTTNSKRVEDVYNTVKSINNTLWYFDNIDRIEAESLLKRDENENGSFLVRKSSSEDPSIPYTLSIKLNSNEIRHYRITILEDLKSSEDSNGSTSNRFYYISKKFKFKSLQELIDYYSQDTIGLCIKLANPCKK